LGTTAGGNEKSGDIIVTESEILVKMLAGSGCEISPTFLFTFAKYKNATSLAIQLGAVNREELGYPEAGGKEKLRYGSIAGSAELVGFMFCRVLDKSKKLRLSRKNEEFPRKASQLNF
jgi:hypothetical protein